MRNGFVGATSLGPLLVVHEEPSGNDAEGIFALGVEIGFEFRLDDAQPVLGSIEFVSIDLFEPLPDVNAVARRLCDRFELLGTALDIAELLPADLCDAFAEGVALLGRRVFYLGGQERSQSGPMTMGFEQRLEARQCEDRMVRPRLFAGNRLIQVAGRERLAERFIEVGIKYRIEDILVNGPPWNMRVAVRAYDYIEGADGVDDYNNRAVSMLEMRWGRLIRWETYEDTQRLADWDARHGADER